MPEPLSRFCVQRDQRVREEIIANAVGAVPIRCR
jgi:hypothetical protein